MTPVFCLTCTIHSELNGILDLAETGGSLYMDVERDRAEDVESIYVYPHIFIYTYRKTPRVLDRVEIVRKTRGIYIYVHTYLYIYMGRTRRLPS